MARRLFAIGKILRFRETDSCSSARAGQLLNILTTISMDTTYRNPANSFYFDLTSIKYCSRVIGNSFSSYLTPEKSRE